MVWVRTSGNTLCCQEAALASSICCVATVFFSLLQTQREQILSDEELSLLGSLLQEHATVMCLPAGDGSAAEDLRINYDGFNSVRAKWHCLVCFCHAMLHRAMQHSVLCVASRALPASTAGQTVVNCYWDSAHPGGCTYGCCDSKVVFAVVVVCCTMQAGRKALAHPDLNTAAVMPFTQPALFLRFDRDAAGCISLSLLMHYISMQTTALRTVSKVWLCS